MQYYIPKHNISPSACIIHPNQMNQVVFGEVFSERQEGFWLQQWTGSTSWNEVSVLNYWTVLTWFLREIRTAQMGLHFPLPCILPEEEKTPTLAEHTGAAMCSQGVWGTSEEHFHLSSIRINACRDSPLQHFHTQRYDQIPHSTLTQTSPNVTKSEAPFHSEQNESARKQLDQDKYPQRSRFMFCTCLTSTCQRSCCVLMQSEQMDSEVCSLDKGNHKKQYRNVLIH